jgi:hypothetical protein
MNTNKTATLNTILTTQDASDFYNLNKILAKPPNSGINGGSQLSLNSIITKEKDDLNLNKSKSSLNTSLENLTTKRNQSPIQRMKSPAKFESSISNKDSIQDLMKSELMKIFQIQHDTVMNFLNKGGGQSQPQPLPKSNIEQQINSILSQQQQCQSNGDQIEFIIETKVKAIDSSSGKKTTTTTKTVSPAKENNYFMKTFDSSTTNKDSKFIKIPLLTTRTNDTPRDHSLSSSPSRGHLPLIEKNLNESNFKLLTFKNNNSKTTNNNLLHLQTKNQQVNKHVKNFIQQTNTNQSLKKLNNYHNFQLLKLNYSSKQITNENFIQPPVQPPPVPTPQVVQPQIEPVKLHHHSVTNKETQVDKPNYDGYILPANIFKENESLDYESNAQIHYKSTQHLRQPQPQQAESNLKKDNYTMTTDSPVANPIAPDILFKMKFNSKRKNREALNNENDIDELFDKDYLNVADLDTDACDDILKMIESEQNKRNNISPTQPPPPHQKTSITQPPPLIDEIQTADILTENLLSQVANTNDQDWKQYDNIMQQQIEDATKQAGQSIGKQRILNELKFIDEKMKLMNQMADHMNSDYKKYDKILDTVQDLRKKHEIIVNNPTPTPTIMKQEKVGDIKPIFYKKKQADEQIKRLKANKKIINSDLRLSDLKQEEEEEEKVEKLLNNESIKLDNSVTNVSKDVFNEIGIDSLDDLNSDKIDEFIEKSNKPSMPSPSKSSQSRKPSNTTTTTRSPSKQSFHSIIINEKPTRDQPTIIKRKTSPIVKKEQQMTDQRNKQNEINSHQREIEAKSLLNDIIFDTYEFDATIDQQQHSFRPSLSVLSLDLTTNPTPTSSKLTKKPSLMTKTILALEKKESNKKNETDRLLKQLEERANLIQTTQKPIKTNKIKSFTSMVHLQEPSKLRAHPDHKSLTYGEQLKNCQSDATITSVTSSKMPKITSKNQIYKIYGTKRVPGLYKGYIKQTPRKVKTYSDTLKELKPNKSQITLIHPNQNKKRRFKPYNNDNIDDLLDWSLNDQLKNILYSNNHSLSNKNNKMKQVKEIDSDQDTLADYDLNDLLEDEKTNDKIYENVLKDLSYLNENDHTVDYIDQVNVNDLKNISFSSESAVSSFIDWDQIDQIIGIK